MLRSIEMAQGQIRHAAMQLVFGVVAEQSHRREWAKEIETYRRAEEMRRSIEDVVTEARQALAASRMRDGRDSQSLRLEAAAAFERAATLLTKSVSVRAR